jgi:zinc/manganese transport system ATP-binding protein
MARAAGDQWSGEILRVQDLTVRLSGRQILDQVSCAVSAGEFVGLIGANGAGKTTLLKVILGLVSPSSGQVLVGGHTRSRRNPLIGYVPQKIDLDPDMPLRARDLIGLGLDGHRYGIPIRRTQRAARIDEMLDAVNATAFAAARVGQLSGGEQQRVMIAHALISRPRILLLDEPLANLDLRSAQEVVGLLSQIAVEHRVAVMQSAHDVNPLLSVMDRVIYLADGRAVSGTTEQVIRTETLSELYRHHVEVIRVQGRILVVAGRQHQDDGPPADILVGLG